MPSIDGGYVLLARAILDSDLMDKPPLWSKLWVWMLCRARQRDGHTRKVGEIFTTIEDMREAMSWRVGYRVEKPSKDEIRKAYEGFTKATMITTAKTTRGLLITILNFEKYQDPNNYEAHTEAHNESVRKPNEAHTIRQEVSQEGDKKGKAERHSATTKPVAVEAQDFILTKSGKKLTGKRMSTFATLWDAFADKRGKAEAADAWARIPQLTDALVAQIVEAARAYAVHVRPELLTSGRTPKMLQGWLTARRWEDDVSEYTRSANSLESIATWTPKGAAQ